MNTKQNNIIFKGAESSDAVYKEQVIREYQDNPLIEALPSIYSIEEVIDNLSYYPYIDEKEKSLEPHYRIHAVQRLFQYFQPLEHHIDLESRISRMLRQGYIARNPFKKEYAEGLHCGYQMILNKSLELDSNNIFRTTGSGFTFIGVSGIGKSSGINRILSMYPQVIVHNEYQGKKFSSFQIVWLKLDCPHDGSIKALCLDFFLKVDNLIGTNYFNKYGTGRHAVNVLLPVMGQIAMSLNIGVLIIDEIQHANMAKSGGTERLLNFFVTLINTIGIPVILIGTPKALNVLQSEFRQARRGSGQGDMIWERMKNDESWDLLLRGMWEYQWTNKVAPFSDNIKSLLYDKSQGITDIAIKLYVMSQIKAISIRKEEVTAEIIENVSRENFKLIQPMIQALRSGNASKIAQYEDINTTINVEQFIHTESSKINLKKKIEEITMQNMRKKSIDSTRLVEQSVLKLMDLDVNPKTAKRIAEGIVKGEKNLLEVNELVKKIYEAYIEEEKKKISKKNKANKGKFSDENDLRLIISKGKENNLSAYEVLKNSGYIRSIKNDLFTMGAS